MRTIVAGSRDCVNAALVWQVLDACPFHISMVIYGDCRGVDRIGKDWAQHNFKSYVPYPADWDKHGKPAGPIRNTEMAKNADALVLIWNGSSSGSADMLKKAKARNLEIMQVIVSDATLKTKTAVLA